SFDYEEAIATALTYRPEIAQQQIRVDSASIVVNVAKNNLLPQLNLVASAALQGLDDGIGSAADEQFQGDQLGYGIGLQLEIPIGNQAARAIYTRTRLQRQQAIEQYQLLIDQIALDIKIAQREVQTAWDEMVANRQAALSAAKALELVEVREAADEPLTPTFVQLKLDL